MGRIGVIFASFRNVFIAVATFAVGALLKLFPTLSIRAYVLLGVVVLVLVSIEQFYTSIRPAARLREIAPLAMDAAAARILDSLKTREIEARMSLFKVVRPSRWLWFCRFFRVMWSNNMNDSPDVNISFPVSEGISGQCFKNKCLTVAGPTELENYKLPEKYLRNGVERLKFGAILCYPV